MTKFICFWCESSLLVSERTKDHLLPRYQGGCDQDNIADCCVRCNNERAYVTGAGAEMKALLKSLKFRLSHADHRLHKFRRRMGRILQLQAKWVALEERKLGYSPSSAFDFVSLMRPGKKRRKWEKECADKRKQA